MKRIELALIPVMLFVFVLTSHAQAPKDGILIKIDQTELDISSGTATATVYYVRSKRLAKVKLEAPVVQAAQGLNISFEPQDEKDTFLMTVSSSEPIVQPMTLIIDGAGRWKHKMQSTAFSVGSGTQVTKN